MDQQDTPDILVEGHLKTLGIKLLSEWDVLVFLYRHQTSLVSAEHIARLLGYGTGVVVEALDSLESLGLVKRSRVSQGARLYQFTAPADPPRGNAFDRLRVFADSRAARLRLAKKLRRNDQPEQNDIRSGLHDTEGGETWLKAS